jgi:hypothetical protein
MSSSLPQSTGVASVRIRPTAVAAAEPLDDPHYLPADPSNLLHADPSRRAAVRFRSGPLTLAGHFYRAHGVPEAARTAAIVMCGPFSSVKEQTLPHYAERFQAVGYSVMTFDSRNFGESEGEPRWHYDPNEIIEDYTSAVSYLLTRADVDPERIVLVGVCMGGGFAVSTAARDKRVKAVVSVAGGFDIGGTFQQFLGVDGFAAYYRRINDLVQRQYETGEVQYVPTTVPSLSAEVPIAAMPNEEAFSYYDRTSRADAPNWSNRMAASSFGPYFIYNAIAHAPLVAPAPLLIVHGTRDLFLLPEYAQQAYDAAIGPKELVWLDTHNHIEVYDQDPYVSEAVAHILRWLAEHGLAG